MLEKLKEEVYLANQELVKRGLVILTWGNVSGRDEETGLVVIKPSGVSYEKMKPSDMVVVNLDGKVIEGDLNPSSDTLTHLEIYKAHPEIKGICHTHSFYATAYAQSGQALKCYGTTHADYFYGDVPITRVLTKKEVEQGYEFNTGRIINEVIKDPVGCPAVLVNNHGPFTFGKSAMHSVEVAQVLEYCCGLAINMKVVNKEQGEIASHIKDKHYFRKHGPDAYYGQKK